MKFATTVRLAVSVAALWLVMGRDPNRMPQAVAAPELGSGTFSLTNIGETQTIFTNQGTDPVGCTVAVTAGSAVVEKQSGGVWTSMGQVPSGEFCVFEGPFAAVRVRALLPLTAGTYSTRGPTNSSEDPDHLVGMGTFSLGAGPARVYVTGSPTWRNVFVTAGTQDLELRATSAGPALLEIPAGGTLHYRGSHSAFWISGADTVTVSVLDDPTEGTWMLLPTVHWTDQFSPLYATATDGWCEASAEQESQGGREWFEYEWQNPYTQQTETRVAAQNIVFVNFQPTVSAATIEEILEENGMAIVTAWFDPDPSDPETSMSWFQCEILEESEYYEDVFGMIEHLEGVAEVEFAEPNGVAQMGCAFPEDEPNDQYFGDQPEFERLSALDAWTEFGYGNAHPVGVAILDCGVDVDHPDLADKIFVNPKKGYRMGVRAWWKSFKVGDVDSSDNDEKALLRTIDVYTEGTQDLINPHGTALAGIVGADTDNETGVAGCGPDIQVLPVSIQEIIGSNGAHAKALDNAAVMNALKALDKHFNKGKHIKNLKVANFSSSGGEDEMQSVTKAMKKDRKENKRLHVSISGNTNAEQKVWPAADPKILGVAGAKHSTSSSEDYWGLSGGFWDGGGTLSTPDLDVYGISAYYQWSKTTYISGSAGSFSRTYSAVEGTSAAAPQISALAALMWSLFPDPTDLTVDLAEQIIKESTKDGYDGVLEFTLAGNTKAIPAVVDFAKAMQAASEE